MATKAEITPEQSGENKKTRFIISHGDKGGVGKSFTAQSIIDYLRSRGESIGLIEADTQNPDVSRMFSDSVPNTMTNLRDENGWMDVMDFVTKYPGYTIVMNTPAGIGEYMKKDMAMFAAFLAEQEIPVELELYWTMNLQHDSVNLLGAALKSYGQYFRKIRVVCNLHFSVGDQKQFFLWNESPLRINLEKNNGMTIFLPGMHMRVVKKLFDHEKIMPFSEAIDASLGERVGLENSERFKLSHWFREMSAALAPAFGHPVVSVVNK